ncbi:DUF2278 family protein [Pengzhenrongella sp.]|uniref:DUF2278 family protein n=1 Tax=Pengzhenrongella sp. TaxID=2888820 RepID=UPI002F953B22
MATPDKVFGFLPGNGVHDVHMNQGNGGSFGRDDGVWQDGGLLLHLVTEQRWVAIFLAFQSQAWHTDDVTGHALGGSPPRPAPGDASVRIVAAQPGWGDHPARPERAEGRRRVLHRGPGPA